MLNFNVLHTQDDTVIGDLALISFRPVDELDRQVEWSRDRPTSVRQTCGNESVEFDTVQLGLEFDNSTGFLAANWAPAVMKRQPMVPAERLERRDVPECVEVWRIEDRLELYSRLPELFSRPGIWHGMLNAGHHCSKGGGDKDLPPPTPLQFGW